MTTPRFQIVYELREPKYRLRFPRQFCLRQLFAITYLVAVLLALCHYCWRWRHMGIALGVAPACLMTWAFVLGGKLAARRIEKALRSRTRFVR